MSENDYDSRGLIRESYRIEGISAPECRSIFLDWALGAGETPPVRDQISALLATYGAQHPDHPMSAVLNEGLEKYRGSTGRRGGRRGRLG